MNDKAREARNEYMRTWRAKNKDKAKKIQADYWERKAEGKVRERKDA